MSDQQEPINPHDFLGRFVQGARQFISFDVGVLALWDQEREVLEPFYEESQQARDANAPTEVRLGQGIIGHVARTCQALYVPDVQQESRYVPVYPTTRSELAVPIVLNGRMLGVFNIESNQVDAYDQVDVAALEKLADQAALIIETISLYNRLQASYDRLQDAHSDMALRNEISRLSTSDEPLEKRLPQMSRFLVQYAEVDCCVITLWDEVHQQPHLLGGWPMDIAAREKIATTVTSILISTGKSIIVNDVAEQEELPTPVLIDSGIRHLIALPLIARRRTIGSVLLLRTETPRPFWTQNLQQLQASLDQIALGIDNQQLLAKTQAHLEESQTLLKLSEIAARSMNLDEMMRQVLELTRSMLDVEAGTILIYDRNEGLLMPLWVGFGFPDSLYRMVFPINVIKSLFALAFNMGHPQYTNDVTTLTGSELQLARAASLENMLVAPLRVQDDPLGVFVVANRKQGYSTDEARLLTAIGSHVASSLRNMEYVERLRLFKGLSQVVQRVSVELASEQVLVAACRSVVEAIEGVDHAGIVLNDNAPVSGTLVAEFPSRAAIGQRLQFEGYEVYNQMQQTLMPIVINDVNSAKDLLGPNFKFLAAMGIKSLMVIPLVVQNEFIGSIGVDSTRMSHQFTSAEIEVMSAVAAQLAISIRNAELFEQLEARTKELAKANQLKSEFLAKMSHELRTPMNSILGFSETLLSGIYGELNERQHDRVSRIQRGGRNLRALIDDLLDLSKIEAGRMEMVLQTVNLKDEMQACLLEIETQAQSKNLKLHFITPDVVPAVTADALRVRQVINNLLSNAVKFTKEGSITVRLEVHAVDGSNREVWTTVADTGVGIDPKDYEIIFDEFRQADGSTTRAFGGTGLGLAISRRLVEMMDGRIWVESQVGQGSTFGFALPVAPNLG